MTLTEPTNAALLPLLLILVATTATNCYSAISESGVESFTQREEPKQELPAEGCDCVARSPCLLHMAACGPAVQLLTAGQPYRTVGAAVAAAPVTACGRLWTPVRVDGAVLWTADSLLRGECSRCRRGRSRQAPAVTAGLPFGANGTGPTAGLFYCLCQIESNCNASIGCVKDPVTLSCGPYQIKEAYWQDASHFAGRALGGDWQTCTTGQRSIPCSWQTALYYMARYGKYCTGASRTPTDEDYARIHNGGPKGCQNANTLVYWKKVKACMEQ